MGGKKRREQPTMQLDAIVDDLEEVVAPELRASLAPPPLPPKKAGTRAWIVGAAVVTIAGVAAAGIGLWLRSSPAEPTPVAPERTAHTETPADRGTEDGQATERAAGAGAEQEAAQASDEAGRAAPALQLEEIVFDDAPPSDAPEPPE